MFARRGLRGWETPLALLGLVVLSYGLWIPWLGLFGNDLPYMWYYHLLGPWGPGEFASIDRPFSAVFYAMATALLGESVLAYHLLLLALRWFSAALLWWVLRLVWPERGRLAALAAALFAVYPGFRQNPIALEFVLHFFVLDLFLLSLAASLLAVLRPSKFWLFAALSALGTAGLFWLEYFIGLEILRPLFLWIVTRRQGLRGREQWRRILAAWTPAVLVVLAFLVWRVFIFSFPTYRPVLLEELRSNPLAALLNLARAVARDVWTSLARAWMQVFRLPEGRRALLAFGGLAAAASALTYILLRRGRVDDAREAADRYSGELALGVGLLAMLAGGSIFWVTGIEVSLSFPWDRSTLSLMLGASLALAGLLEMLASPRYRAALAAVLVGLAVGMHFVNAQEYRAEWSKLQDFAWQLTWRAPQLEPGTLLLFDVIPLNRYSDNDLTALLNWTYAPDLNDRNVPFKTFDLTLRLNSEHPGLPGLEKDLPVENTHRGITFRSTTSSALALLYNPPACLRLLGQEDLLLPGLPERIASVLPITRLEQVRAGDPPARPPVQLGPEPPRGWCYYFQMADLARQRGDWPRVSELGDEAFAAGLHPEDPSELLPFIEGYARVGQYEQARALINEAGSQAGLRPRLCALVRSMPEAQSAESFVGVQSELHCAP